MLLSFNSLIYLINQSIIIGKYILFTFSVSIIFITNIITVYMYENVPKLNRKIPKIFYIKSFRKHS